MNWYHGTTSASMSKVTMWRSRGRCVIKPACSVSFLLSINIVVWQNVLYFPNDPSYVGYMDKNLIVGCMSVAKVEFVPVL